MILWGLFETNEELALLIKDMLTIGKSSNEDRVIISSTIEYIVYAGESLHGNQSDSSAL